MILVKITIIQYDELKLKCEGNNMLKLTKIKIELNCA